LAPFLLTPLTQTKVVLIGDGLSPTSFKSDGLAYSSFGLEPPPATKALFCELVHDLKLDNLPHNGNLTSWAKQGVLLLNAPLTEPADQTGVEQDDHSGLWEDVMEEVLVEAVDVDGDMVFVLIGDLVRDLASGLSLESNHLCIEADQPKLVT